MTDKEYIEQLEQVKPYMRYCTPKKAQEFINLCKKDSDFLRQARAIWQTRNDMYNATYEDVQRFINSYYRKRGAFKKDYKDNIKDFKIKLK